MTKSTGVGNAHSGQLLWREQAAVSRNTCRNFPQYRGRINGQQRGILRVNNGKILTRDNGVNGPPRRHWNSAKEYQADRYIAKRPHTDPPTDLPFRAKASVM